MTPAPVSNSWTDDLEVIPEADTNGMLDALQDTITLAPPTEILRPAPVSRPEPARSKKSRQNKYWYDSVTGRVTTIGIALITAFFVSGTAAKIYRFANSGEGSSSEANSEAIAEFERLNRSAESVLQTASMITSVSAAQQMAGTFVNQLATATNAEAEFKRHASKKVYGRDIEKTKALGKKYESLSRQVNAATDRMAAIPGVGEILRQRIEEVIRQQPGSAFAAQMQHFK